MLTDIIKLSKAQISKIIQWGGSFASWLGNQAKKALANVEIPSARYNLPGLVSNWTSHNKWIWKKNSWKKSCCQSRKRIYFIQFEWRHEWCY